MPKSHAQAGGVRLGPALHRNIDDVTYGRAAHKQWQAQLGIGANRTFLSAYRFAA